MDKPKPEPEKPRLSYRKKVLLGLLLLFCLFMVFIQISSAISGFFDLNTLLPFKTYTGLHFSFAYPQNWRSFGSGDDLSIEPRSSLWSLPEPDNYIFNDMYFETRPATAASASGAIAEDQQAWERRLPNYRSVALPHTISIGGTSWIQLAGTYELVPKDGSTIPVEEVALSTVYRTKDGSYFSFLMVFSADPDIFDRMYQQVLQNIIFHSFSFR